MTVKEKIERLRDGLRDGDVDICGDSPKWIQDELLQRIETLLERASDEAFHAEAESFSIGAIRFVADRCGSECDTLVESLSGIAEGR